MYFEDANFDLRASRLNWEYKLGADSMSVSGQEINPATLSMSLLQIENRLFWVFKWPTALLDAQEVVVRDLFGREVWQLDLKNSSESKTWQRMKGRVGNWNFGWSLNKVQDLPILKGASGFRWCVRSQNEEMQLQLCSGVMSLRRDQKNQLTFYREESMAPLALHQKKRQESSGALTFTTGKIYDSYLISGNGDSLSLRGKTPDLELIEMVSAPGQQVRLLGEGRPPKGRYSWVNYEQESDFIKLIGFEDTLKLQKRIWSLTVPVANERIYFSTALGGLFSFMIPQDDLIGSFLRVHLESDAPKQTYSSTLRLEGRVPAQAKITGASGEVLEVKSGGSGSAKYIDWNLATPKKGDYNQPRLELDYRGRKISQYYEVYRGSPGEVSARLSGFISQSASLLLGEVAGAYWFERLFWWNNDIFSRQRWGFFTKYNRSINKLKFQTGTEGSDLQTLNAEVKYRFTQGLWTRDESVGLQLAYQKVTLQDFDVPMIGGGLFWGRSMPRIFDDIFNLFPFFRYPKWVDTDFSYYTGSLSSNYKAAGNFSLNFHGQMLFTDSAFFEVGFGIRTYNFSSEFLQQKAALTTIYGTTGLGLKF